MRALTRTGPPLWSRAMQSDEPLKDSQVEAGKGREEDIKKARASAKGVKEAKEARLAAALRENLRRRKAAQRKETE